MVTTCFNMKTCISSLYSLITLLSCVGALVIPEELPSILSLIYSNIPPIKKGTDSRVGLGFRLGPHADFQVLLELGPQRETSPLGPQSDSKRRRQATPRPALSVIKNQSNAGENDVIMDTSGGKWLVSWKSGLLNASPKYVHLKKENNPSQLSNDVVSHLQQLYKNKSSTENKTDSDT